MGSRRVLFLPMEIAGYASRLQAALPEFGWDADVLDLYGDSRGFGGEPPQVPLMAAMTNLTAWSVKGPVRRLVGRFVSVPWRLFFLLRYVSRYEVIVYLYGTTLLGGVDLWYAKRRGVRIVAVFLGSDSRPPFLSGRHAHARTWIEWRTLWWYTRRTSRRVRRFERWADQIVCNPASAQFLTRPFVNWFAIGMPGPLPAVDSTARRDTQADDRASPRAIRVAHAPTRPREKGTALIEAALGRCEGNVQVTVLSGVSNKEVLELLRSSDFVLDELYSDTPMGGLDVESAMVGTAVFTFGYAADFLRSSLETFGLPTQGYARPEELDAVLRRAVADPDWRAAIAAENHQFAVQTWSARGVAGRLTELFEGAPPSEWSSDPADIDYALGWGMDAETARMCWQGYIERFGEDALELPPGSPVLAAIREAIRGSRLDRLPSSDDDEKSSTH